MNASERYADATREQLLAVVAAADACWHFEAEFNHPDGELTSALDDALLKCPGTHSQNFNRLAHGDKFLEAKS